MESAPSLNYRRPAWIGLLALLVLAGGSFAWTFFAEISGAAIASGTVVVEGKPKSVQHLDGGIVKRIFVTAGDRVEQDQVLVLLDDTTIAANLAIYERRLREAIVRKERLAAEMNGETIFVAPDELAALLGLGDLTSSMTQQVALLKARHSTQESQLAQLDEKVAQFKNQIAGVKGLRGEKEKQLESFAEEAVAVAALRKKNLTPKSRFLELERSRADLRGQIAEHRAEIARLQNSIAETRIGKLQLVREFRERAISELEKSETQIDEIRQQMEATRKQLSRVAIRAPVAGIVHELNLFTIGGVVQPGQTVMQVIPQADEHEIELNVDPQSIDQIHVGQRAIVRFPAFHQRTTPELEGTVGRISPSSVMDEQSGLAFYRVAVEVSDREMGRLGDKSLIPGMPVEALFPTTDRTVMSYLVKPLLDHLNHALREE